MDNKKKKLFLILGISVIVIVIFMFAVFFSKNNNKTEKIIKDEKMVPFDKFNEIFNNTIYYENSNISNVHKIDAGKDIVYINNTSDKKTGSYYINANIPYLNINNERAKKINQEITDLFFTKIAENKKSSNNGETIYTVDYAAYINQNVLSLIIKSSLKENNSAQRIIIKTYTYNLASNELITLNELLTIKGVNIINAQKIINEEINKKANETEELEKTGYVVYKRKPNSSIYKIEKSNFYILGKDNKIYVIYPYGNSNFTSETDVILLN